jgi:hypothetical protein
MPKRDEECQILTFPAGKADMPTSTPVVDNSGSGGGGTMDPQIQMKDYIDARDDAVESRLSQKLDRLSTKGTIWAAMATALGVVFGAMAIAGDRFDAGMSVSPTIVQMQNAQAAVDRDQNAKLDMVDAKIDILLERTGGKTDVKPQR